VILLPENLFYNTTAAGVIVVLTKRKPAARKGKLFLLNASRHFRKGRPKNYLPEEDIRALAATYLKGEAVEGELAIITTQQAKEADYNLSPSRWVGQADDAAHRDLPQLIGELSRLSHEAEEIDRALFGLLKPLVAE
jgi:type I restriction enzyme M protein